MKEIKKVKEFKFVSAYQKSLHASLQCPYLGEKNGEKK